jgi:hypothetical protein
MCKFARFFRATPLMVVSVFGEMVEVKMFKVEVKEY